MFYVYLIQIAAFASQRYAGFTTDLKERLKTHNAGESVHTTKYKPWKLVGYHAFGECRLKSPAPHFHSVRFSFGQGFIRVGVDPVI